MRKSESKQVRKVTVPAPDLGLLQRFFRALYPQKTIDSIADDTGVSRATVKKWVEGDSAPGWRHFFPLLFAYGPEFLVEVWPDAPRWLHEAYTRHQIAQVIADQEANTRRLEALHERI